MLIETIELSFAPFYSAFFDLNSRIKSVTREKNPSKYSYVNTKNRNKERVDNRSS